MDYKAFLSRRKLLRLGALVLPSFPLALLLGQRRLNELERAKNRRTAVLRPPAALAENDFLRTCIGCRQCGDVCPNRCIRFSAGPLGTGTPYLRPRESACILCMRCTRVCPTGALTPVTTDTGEDIQKHVKMGCAVVDKNICNSYNGYACGSCVQACPFQGQALRALTWERPEVNPEYCVGCGLCERACIVYPQAIRVVPTSVES